MDLKLPPSAEQVLQLFDMLPGKLSSRTGGGTKVDSFSCGDFLQGRLQGLRILMCVTWAGGPGDNHVFGPGSCGLDAYKFPHSTKEWQGNTLVAYAVKSLSNAPDQAIAAAVGGLMFLLSVLFPLP